MVSGVANVRLDRPSEAAFLHGAIEPLHVEPDVRCNSSEAIAFKASLMSQERLVHRPERILLRGRLGCFGGEVGAGVQLGVGEVPPDQPDPFEPADEAFDRHPRCRAVATAKVAELDQRDSCVSGAEDVGGVGDQWRRRMHDGPE